jgi:NADPH-dependent 2,4-dienoyl-CoA reductase/sulfur reductase-like enzyme
MVLGSGFVALQAAWAARQRGLQVTVVELLEQILPRVLDAAAARILHRQLLAHGVDVRTGTRTDGLETDRRGVVRVSTRGASPFTVDAVIVATGARPNDGLLPECLEPGQPGIPVAATMETVVDGVFAAGDVTRGPTAAGGPREIHALWPTAVEQGKVAGANLAGAGLVYGGSLSMNVTEMFGLTVASLGRFVEEEADDVFESRDLPGISYLKLVSRSGVPVGAISLGEPEGATLLGRLRPFARQKRPLPDLPAFLEGRDLDRRLVGRRTPKENMPCASLR